VFYWGTLLGAAIGFYLEEIPGGMFGAILGFLVDKSLHALQQPRFAKINPAELAQLQREFFVATFSVMGHVATAVGSEAGDENEALNKVIARLNLPPDVHQEAIELYGQGKRRNFDLNRVMFDFYNACRSQTHLLEMFLEIQLLAAYRDGEIHPQQNQILLNIAKMLELSRGDYDRILSTIRAEAHFSRDKMAGALNNGSGNDEDAYAILYLSPTATNEEIKKAYRRLTSMHHPDKLVAKGLPEEMLKIAEDKTREIRLAYERIRAIRNF
jgi:DnaJ like chaperone protein